MESGWAAKVWLETQRMKEDVKVLSAACYSGRWMPRSIQMWEWTLRCFLHGEMIKESLCWQVCESDLNKKNTTWHFVTAGARSLAA